jgi:hypothetical protein
MTLLLLHLNTYPGKGATAEYKEGILVGYRWYDTKKIEPQFPFGYGLSYTDFSISHFSADKKSYEKTDETSVQNSRSKIQAAATGAKLCNYM